MNTEYSTCIFRFFNFKLFLTEISLNTKKGWKKSAEQTKIRDKILSLLIQCVQKKCW